ncbi:MAG: hypothetical protein ABI459_12115, partial [Deltaproteobacteria bacterium]
MSTRVTSSGYPMYSRAERVADAIVQGLGVVLGLVGTVLLIIYAALFATHGALVAVSIYAGLMLFGLVASACYHFTP